jgi:hypothetical protein
MKHNGGRLARAARAAFRARRPRGSKTSPKHPSSGIAAAFGSVKPQTALISSETERAGFEPAMEFDPHTRLAGECLQPLGHLSLDRGAKV